MTTAPTATPIASMPPPVLSGALIPLPDARTGGSQIHGDIQLPPPTAKTAHLKHCVIFGGVNQNPQVRSLRDGVDIVVATPGRLLDLMNQGFVDLRSVEVFVLDEADRMLDMGFIHDIRKIVAKIPQKRQTLFFSATMPSDIRQLAASILRNPVSVQVAAESRHGRPH